MLMTEAKLVEYLTPFAPKGIFKTAEEIRIGNGVGMASRGPINELLRQWEALGLVEVEFRERKGADVPRIKKFILSRKGLDHFAKHPPRQAGLRADLVTSAP